MTIAYDKPRRCQGRDPGRASAGRSRGQATLRNLPGGGPDPSRQPARTCPGPAAWFRPTWPAQAQSPMVPRGVGCHRAAGVTNRTATLRRRARFLPNPPGRRVTIPAPNHGWSWPSAVPEPKPGTSHPHPARTREGKTVGRAMGKWPMREREGYDGRLSVLLLCAPPSSGGPARRPPAPPLSALPPLPALLFSSRLRWRLASLLCSSVLPLLPTSLSPRPEAGLSACPASSGWSYNPCPAQYPALSRFSGLPSAPAPP